MQQYHPRYVNTGARNYAEQPVPRYRRGAWELQLVSGTAYPAFGLSDAELGLNLPRGGGWTGAQRILWLFRPACIHGWRDQAGNSSNIAVIHLDGVPEEVDAVLGAASWARLTISPAPARILGRFQHLWREIADLTEPVFTTQAQQVAALRSTALIISVAAMLHESAAPRTAPLQTEARHATTQRSITDVAVAWYEANMHTGCGIPDVARGIAVSESTLGRAFRREMGEPTSRVFMRRRMSRAAWMLRNGSEPVSVVAEACGYQDQSAFARQVRRSLGAPPRVLRGGESGPGGKSGP